MLVRRYEDIAVGLLCCVNADISRSHPLGELRHCVASLGYLARVPHRAVLTADIPPYVSIHVSDNHCVVDILRNCNALGPAVCRVRVTVRNVNLGHPYFLAAVFKGREVHLTALSTVEVSAEHITVSHSL